MLSMNGIIVCELILGVVLMSLIFASFANTDLIADSSSKSKHGPESDSVGATMKPGRPLTDLSPDVHAHSNLGRLSEHVQWRRKPFVMNETTERRVP